MTNGMQPLVVKNAQTEDELSRGAACKARLEAEAGEQKTNREIPNDVDPE